MSRRIPALVGAVGLAAALSVVAIVPTAAQAAPGEHRR